MRLCLNCFRWNYCTRIRNAVRAIGSSLYLRQPGGDRKKRERGSEQLLDTPQRLINESARGEQGERGRDLPLSLFQMKSFRTSLSLLLFGKLMKRSAFVLRSPLLTDLTTDTFSRSLADFASHGASAASSSIRCIIKYGQRQWQALNRV